MRYKHDAVGTLEFCNEILNRYITDENHKINNVILKQKGLEYAITIHSNKNG